MRAFLLFEQNQYNPPSYNAHNLNRKNYFLERLISIILYRIIIHNILYKYN